MRLIDADKLQWDRYAEIVSNQPTAFDIDAVVEELEKEQESLDTDIFAKENNDWYREFNNGKMEGLDKAVEILRNASEKSGGS